MYFAGENIETLLIAVVLTAIAATATLVGSVLCGATFAYHARPTIGYGVVLALLFAPFAVGGSVWAYLVTRLAVWSDLQTELVAGGTAGRAAVLLLLCLAKTLPLGTFFCTTTLQRYTSELRPYFQIHHLSFPFFLLCGLNRIPRSLLVLLGLFGGAVMAAEASLPTFLYRANPGTAPETANLLLARIFRETYASAGPQSLPTVATLGALVALLLLGAGLGGSWIGKAVVDRARLLFKRTDLTAHVKIFSFLGYGLAICVLIPGVITTIGLLAPARGGSFWTSNLFIEVLEYRGIVGIGVFIGGLIAAGGIALAVRLRYSQQDRLATLEQRPAAACLLLLPAFVPVLTIIALLGRLSGGHMAGAAGYASMFISHIALHYPVFQFICITLIAAIPEPHVAWQRTMRMRYAFSLATDGFRRHIAVIVSLVGLGTVQVVTDGSIARWFSHLVKAPEEALYAAVFGRLSSAAEAALIAWSVGLVALVVCAILASAYVRELGTHPRHA